MSEKALALIRQERISAADLTDMNREELAALVVAMKQRNIALLGEGQGFVTRNKDGFVETIKAQVALSEARKEIYSVGGKNEITAQGYNRCNQIAGLSILNPPRLFFAGDDQSNPYVEFDNEKKRTISFVAIRRIAIGPGPTQNIVAIDSTLLFSTYVYLLQDLQKRIKKVPAAGGYGHGDYKPEHLEKVIKRCFPFEVETGVILYADLAHKEIQDALSQHTQRCKFAERIATTIATRNCLKAHPAIAAQTVQPVGGIARVTVYGTKTTYDFSKLQQMAEDISAGRADLKEVEVQTVEAEATLDEVDQAQEEVIDTDVVGGSPDEEETPPPPEEPPQRTAAEQKKWDAAMKKVLKEKERLDAKTYFALIEEREIRKLEALSVEELNSLATDLKELA